MESYGIYLGGLHMIGSLVFFIGLVLFVVWAIRDLKAKTLMKVAVVMLVLGLLASLLTMKFGLGMMRQFDNDDFRGGRMMEGFEEIDDTPGSDEEPVLEEEAE